MGIVKKPSFIENSAGIAHSGGVSEPLAVLARVVKTDFRPALDRELEIVLVGREIHRIIVDVARHVDRELLFEIALHGSVGKGEPARGINVRRVVDRVDLVFALQALSDDFELQRAHCPQQQ